MTPAFLIALVGSASIGLTPTPAPGAATYYFPTVPGTTWVLQDQKEQRTEFRVASARPAPGGIREITVEIEVVVPVGDSFTPAGGRFPSGKLLVSKFGIRQAESYPGTGYSDTPIPLLRLPLRECDTWHATAKILLDRSLDVYSVASGPERVAVPAGVFDAIRVESVIKQDGVPDYPQTRWFAPGYGIVKWERGLPGDKRYKLWEMCDFTRGK